MLCIQPLAEDAWPKFLRDERDKPVLYHDFVDPLTELPIGLTNHRATQLEEALLKLFIEIKGKLTSFRKHL